VSQYGVFENPIPQARRAFPFVAILQSELADTGRDRIVAPLVPRTRMTGTVGRLTPVVKVANVEHVLLVPRMTAIAATDLRTIIDRLTAHRSDIVAALDYLFLGV
jgi:toxin CcdB